MRKFIVHTRALAGYTKTGDAPLLVEIDGEMIAALEDPSVMWLPNGEFYFRIMSPSGLWEPREVIKADRSREKIIVPPVYHSHSVYHSIEEARAAAEGLVRSDFEFQLRKHGTEIDFDALLTKCGEIQEVRLP
jgi:hypothetical protein